MADATATLGISVDSAAAEQSLSKFASIAKRTGETVDQVSDRFNKLNAGARGIPAPLATASAAASSHASQLEKVAVSTQKATAASAFFIRGIQGMVVALVGGGLYKALEASVNALASLGDRMQDTRLSGETLQGLRIGAAGARVSTDELNKALDAFTEVSKKAAPEAKEFYRALSNINPALAQAFKDQAGKAGGQKERLKLLADGFSQARTEVQKYQLAQKGLNTDNDRVIGMFDRGREALSQYIQTARDYGIMVDDAFIKKSQEAQRMLGILSTVLADKLRVAIVDMIPDLQRLLPFLERLGAELRDVFASFALPAERPTATLEREIRDSVATVAGYQKQIDDLTATKGKSFFGTGLGDWELDADIKKTETKIQKEKEFQALRSGIIAGRPDAQFGPDLPKPANNNAPGFMGRDSLKDARRTPFDSAVTSIQKHIAAMRADSEAVGQSVGEHARLRTEAQLLEAAQQKGGKATAEQMEKIKALGEAARDAAQKLALARVQDNIKFDRNTAFLSQEDVQIAQQLKDIYPNVAQALSSVEAAGMRVNNVMKELSSSIENNLTTGLTDIVSGAKSVSQGFSDMASSILKDIEKMIVKLYIVGPIMKALQGGLGGIGGGLASLIPSANGNVFAANDNGISKYSNQIVASPTMFAFANGIGLMGEAGAEAIMPLTRGPNGKLGVQASGGDGGGKTEVHIHGVANPQNVDVKETIDGRGNRRLDLTMDDAVSAALSRPGSSTRKAMGSNFGARPVGVRR